MRVRLAALQPVSLVALFLSRWLDQSSGFLFPSQDGYEYGAVYRMNKTCVNKTCDIGANALRFLVVADWGGYPFWPYYTVQQKKVAEAMQVATKIKKPHFVLSLGDNFYFKGVDNLQSNRFKDTFEDVYKYDDLKELPWYVIMGNHDHYGNADAEVQYSTRSKRWNLPSPYYELAFRLSPSNKTISILMLDTIILCGNTKYDSMMGKVMSYFQGEAYHRGHDQPHVAVVPEADSQRAWAWLEQKLARSTADYQLVMGHFPVYSASSHGPTECLVKRLEPLLRKYRVQAYFSGHDHNLQHIKVENGTDASVVHYVISGAAGYEDDSKVNLRKIPEGSFKYFFPQSSTAGRIGMGTGGFVFVDVRPANARVTFFDGEMTIKHRFSLKPRVPQPSRR